jgi:hypothetical protein
VFPIGEAEVTCTATDNSGNASTCSFKVTVTQGFGVVAGSVAMSCDGDEDSLLNAAVDAFSQAGDLVGSALTQPDGSYEITELTSGASYRIGVMPPLGFSADEDDLPVDIHCGQTSTADFSLSCMTISANPRTIGFWKHQLGVALGGNGAAQVDETMLCSYLDAIESHFNSNEINQVVVYVPPVSDACADKLLVAKELLNLKGNVDLTARAKQQLSALLLNVSAGYIGQMEVISEDGATVSQAITYSDNLIDDPAGDHETAKTICDDINNGRMIAAWVVPLEIADIAYKVVVPVSYSLSQNHPNPFNPVTEIRFSIPVASSVRLDIFNVSGQRVTTLVNRHLEAGDHSVSWDGSNVASGVYLYRMEADGFVETRKMVLLK